LVTPLQLSLDVAVIKSFEPTRDATVHLSRTRQPMHPHRKSDGFTHDVLFTNLLLRVDGAFADLLAWFYIA
jgi:hypothetical protein